MKHRNALLVAIGILVLIVGILVLWQLGPVNAPIISALTTEEERWDSRLDQLRVYIDESNVDYSKPYWEVYAAWITVNGSWEQTPRWAWVWIQNILGGDHHVYGLVEPNDQDKVFVLTWPDGAQRITPREQNRLDWTDEPIYASYPPSIAGPYGWGPEGNAERLAGIGLPRYLPWQTLGATGGFHTSVLAVWRLRDATPPTSTPTIPPSITPTPTQTVVPEWKDFELRVFGIVLPVSLKEK